MRSTRDGTIKRVQLFPLATRQDLDASMPPVIGVDFDNTLVDYTEVMRDVAVAQGVITPENQVTKKTIRDSFRRLPNGEMEWQRLQAAVYGSRIGEARLMEGVEAFFRLCSQREIPVYVISHKTEYASLDKTGTRLRVAAMNWLKDNRCFDGSGLGLDADDVHFEPTRQEKIKLVSRLGCTHFVDDLEETFQEASFPPGVIKILHSPQANGPVVSNIDFSGTWQQITDYVFDAKR